jgi:putative FmdB family regulatory protein
MAVYEYLCTKCGKQFELMRPMSEADKPVKCPKCGSEAQKVMSGFGSKTGCSTQPAGEPLRQNEIHSPNCLAPPSDLAGGVEPLPVSGQFGGGEAVWRREMAQKSLVQMLEELASKVRSLEREKSKAVARALRLESEKGQDAITIQALGRQVGELGSLIALAAEKVDEILKEGATGGPSQPTAVKPPAESTSSGQLREFSADPKRGLKERSVMPWRSD